MLLALHLRITISSLILCMFLSGNAFSMIHPAALVLTTLVAWLAHKLPRYRQGIETAYLVALPLYCILGAVTGSSIQDVGGYLALGLCGSVYGLAWFGLDPESPDPTWRRWTTGVPVLILAGVSLPTPVFHGPGLGTPWIIHAALAVVVVVFVAVSRRHASPTAIWSFAAALTLCLAIRTFQNLEQPNTLDIALVFLPYAAGVLTTLASRTSRRRAASTPSRWADSSQAG
jgi:hypothetical protein